jgi:hypothetical protein
MPDLIALCRLRLLRCSNDSTRVAEPDVFHLCSPNDFPAVVSANHAALCDPAIVLRGTRKAEQDLQLADIYFEQYLRQDLLE